MATPESGRALDAQESYLVDEIDDDDPDLHGERSYASRVLDAYADMRASTRDLIESRPSEGRLLMLAIMSDMIFLAARSLSHVVAPPAEVANAMTQNISVWVILAFLFRTSLFYAFAAVANVVSKIFGGTGDWYRSRCAVFWAAFVSAPVELAAAMISVGEDALRRQIPALDFPILITTPYFIGPIAFGFFLAAGVAEAQGFRYTYRVMAVSAVLILGLLWLVTLTL